MCLFLERLWVKKYHNLSGKGIFSNHSEYFPHVKNLKLLFCSTAFVDKNIIYNLFYQLVVNMVGENNLCLMALIILADLPFFWEVFPHINHKLMK